MTYRKECAKMHDGADGDTFGALNVFLSSLENVEFSQRRQCTLLRRSIVFSSFCSRLNENRILFFF